MTITTATQYTVAAGSNLTGTSPKVNLLAGSTFLANSGGKMDVKSAAALTQQSGAGDEHQVRRRAQRCNRAPR